jgi:hypothetical protein
MLSSVPPTIPLVNGISSVAMPIPEFVAARRLSLGILI